MIRQPIALHDTSMCAMHLIGKCCWTDLDAIMPIGLGSSHKLVTLAAIVPSLTA